MPNTRIIFLLLCFLAASESSTTPLPPPSIVLDDDNVASIIGHIDTDLAQEVITTLLLNKPQYLYINSPGGSIAAGNRILTHVQNLPNLICIAEKAYSMAFVILQACKTRYITPYATAMQHQASLFGIAGTFQTTQNYLNMLHSIETRMIELQAHRIKMDPHDFANRITNEWWLMGEDIITNNVADAIITDITCTPRLIKQSKTLTLENPFTSDTITHTTSACPLI